MHFFIDPSGLPTQASAEAYGPAATNSASEFRLTSQFTLPAARPAYACQEGQLLVLEATDPDRVTLVLKPLGGLDVGLGAVRYYVYRGVQKDSFLASGALRARTAADNSAALKLFWKAVDAAKAQRPGQADPVPTDLVVPATAANQPLDAYFGGQLGYHPLVVKEGSSLGNFTAATIGFEIITDTYGLTLDLAYGRRASYAVLNLDLDNLTGLAKAAARDAILSFIDPAAFFGLHAEVGLRAGTSSQLLTGTAAVAQAVQPFATAHRAYLDIRNEHGRSYNFSDSYHNAAGQDLGRLGAYTTYATAGWPLHYVDLSAAPAGGTNLQLQLRRDANASPQLFCEAGRYGSPAQPLGPCFAPPADLAELTDAWTHPLPFYLPGTAATYLKLHYYRPALLASPPDGVLARGHRLDNLFDLSHLPADATANAPVQHAFAPAPVLVAGQRATSLDDYAFVATSGIYASDERAVCYLQEQHGPDNPARTDLYPPNATGTTSPGLLSDVRAGFLRTQVALSATPVSVAAGGAPVGQVADIYAYSGTPSYRESLSLLCLTAAELQALASTPGPSPLHPRYLVFADTSPAGGLLDDTDEACLQYSVQVQGLDPNGSSTTVAPTPAVTVLATTAGFVLTSAGLAGQLAAAPKPPVVYTRDFEEAVGKEPFQKETATTLEDTYVQLSAPLKSVVDDFQKNSKNIKGQDPALYKQEYAALRALVNTAGNGLFQAGVAYVKAGLGHAGAPNPDDRPLYWGRIKVAVMLKQHPLFANEANLEVDANGRSNGRVKPASPLAQLVQLLEETSRNYTGVSFAAAGPGVKKILLTGYDPFQLDNNQYQVNPSDIIVSALHGTNTHDPLTKAITGFIQVMIFPVRYRDFDSSLQPGQGQGEGVAETYIKPFVTSVDMIVTISQGGRGLPYKTTPDYYDIEHYATNTRGGFRDNLNETRPAYDEVLRSMPPVPIVTNAADPSKNNSDNMEWLETTLPEKMRKSPANLHDTYAIVKVNGSPVKVVNTKLPDSFKRRSPKGQMYEASGGDYLSNEIFYRVARMRQQLRPSLATGHLHTPVIGSARDRNGLDMGDDDPTGTAEGSAVDFTKMRRVIDNVRIILDNGLALEKK